MLLILNCCYEVFMNQTSKKSNMDAISVLQTWGIIFALATLSISFIKMYLLRRNLYVRNTHPIREANLQKTAMYTAIDISDIATTKLTLQDFNQQMIDRLNAWIACSDKSELTMPKVRAECEYFLFPIKYRVLFDENINYDKIYELHNRLIEIFVFLTIINENKELFDWFLQSATISSILRIDIAAADEWLNLNQIVSFPYYYEDDYKDLIFNKIIIAIERNVTPANKNYYLSALKGYSGFKAVYDEERGAVTAKQQVAAKFKPLF